MRGYEGKEYKCERARHGLQVGGGAASPCSRHLRPTLYCTVVLATTLTLTLTVERDETRCSPSEAAAEAFHYCTFGSGRIISPTAYHLRAKVLVHYSTLHYYWGGLRPRDSLCSRRLSAFLSTCSSVLRKIHGALTHYP